MEHDVSRPAARWGHRGYRGAPYGFALLVSALTALLGCAIVAGGFAAAWDTFEGVREYADRNIANEDSYVAYADGGWFPLVRVGLAVSGLLLVLALCVVTVLHAAYAVGSSPAARDGGPVDGGLADEKPVDERPADEKPSQEQPLTVRALWRRTRGRLPAALAVNALCGLTVLVVALVAYVLWMSVELGEVPGVEPTPLGGTASPRYTLVGWVLPFAVLFLGPLLYFRLSLATAETVVGRRSPFAALRRSWVLTRRARWRTLGSGTLLTAAAVLVFLLVRYAAGPLAHYAGLGMLRISGDNVWITGVLTMITPTAVALLLLPPLVMPLVCATFSRLYGDLRAREEHGPGPAPRR
ncbi:hypothetical protein [Streptomyces sp. SYP-A7185]|uniref:hypothetical protein n=1 Tax=Streptomyces sp. SYP-A7185 TaxID=3040076 RepID=UPI0038F6E0FE